MSKLATILTLRINGLIHGKTRHRAYSGVRTHHRGVKPPVRHVQERHRLTPTSVTNRFIDRVERGALEERRSCYSNFGGEFGAICLTVEAKVFWLKMKGDHFGYSADFEVGDERKNVVEQTMSSYKAAQVVVCLSFVLRCDNQ
ncbi:putative 14-3-3 protein [Helianthus anomalus]